MAEVTEDRVLDMRGFQCPIPVVKTNLAIREMADGEVLKVLATDKGALSDFPAWAEDTGNELVASGEEGDALVFYIRKGQG
ncbi:MAG TPA: sulfurtransferase TusA family protein [Actinomycetota bacterium]